VTQGIKLPPSLASPSYMNARVYLWHRASSYPLLLHPLPTECVCVRTCVFATQGIELPSVQSLVINTASDDLLQPETWQRFQDFVNWVRVSSISPSTSI